MQNVRTVRLEVQLRPLAGSRPIGRQLKRREHRLPSVTVRSQIRRIRRAPVVQFEIAIEFDVRYSLAGRVSHERELLLILVVPLIVGRPQVGHCLALLPLICRVIARVFAVRLLVHALLTKADILEHSPARRRCDGALREEQLVLPAQLLLGQLVGFELLEATIATLVDADLHRVQGGHLIDRPIETVA